VWAVSITTGHRRRVYAYFEGVLGKTFKDADSENVHLAAECCANGLFGGGVEVPAQLFPIGAGAFVVRDPCACVVDLRERPLPAVFVRNLN